MNVFNIFDDTFNGMPRSEMYRSWLVPDVFPHERQPVLSNWPADDLEAYCGVYSPERRSLIQIQVNVPRRYCYGVQ